ncbi:hypothetical protein EJ04DRAFT_514716 [Polyplosphaeria fusca]|uniref:Swi5-domain-containing protein n=1 Tax=Polyplosphaeria fusca TaxID=682080 RepID=A0A9P4V0G2_9PLEO|nr:hypothetical protein EJ04DRAFT_514716 [Polyplosphaeria fusca]
MRLRAGVSEVPDSDEEPLTSSPVPFVDGANESPGASPQSRPQDKDELHHVTGSHHASISNHSLPISEQESEPLGPSLSASIGDIASHQKPANSQPDNAPAHHDTNTSSNAGPSQILHPSGSSNGTIESAQQLRNPTDGPPVPVPNDGSVRNVDDASSMEVADVAIASPGADARECSPSTPTHSAVRSLVHSSPCKVVPELTPRASPAAVVARGSTAPRETHPPPNTHVQHVANSGTSSRRSHSGPAILQHLLSARDSMSESPTETSPVVHGRITTLDEGTVDTVVEDSSHEQEAADNVEMRSHVCGLAREKLTFTAKQLTLDQEPHLVHADEEKSKPPGFKTGTIGGAGRTELDTSLNSPSGNAVTAIPTNQDGCIIQNNQHAEAYPETRTSLLPDTLIQHNSDKGTSSSGNTQLEPDAQTIATSRREKPTSPAKASTPRNTTQENLLAELKAKKAALLTSLVNLPAMQSLIDEDDVPSSPTSSQASNTEPTDADVMAAANKIVKKHIKLLHEYNEIKDVGQGLMGLIADQRGVRIVEVQDEFGIDSKD